MMTEERLFHFSPTTKAVKLYPDSHYQGLEIHSVLWQREMRHFQREIDFFSHSCFPDIVKFG